MKLLIPALAVGWSLTGFASAQFDGPAPVAWRWAQGSPVAPTGSPAVVDKNLYVAVGQRMYGVNSETGNTLWRFPSGDPLQNAVFKGQPVVVGDLLICRASNGSLHAVNRLTGQGIWQKRLLKAIVNDPIPCGDNFVVQEADNNIQLLAADTGEDVWNEPLKLANGIDGKISCTDSNIYVFSQTGDLSCISASSKKTLWNKKLAVVNADAKPTLSGDYVYFNSGSFVVCFNAISGTLKWQRDLGNVLQLWPVVSGEGIGVLSRDGQFYSLDLTGRMRVKKPIDLLSPADSVPAALGGFYAAVTKSGVVQLINGRNGQTSWNYLVHPSNPKPNSAPLVSGVTASGAPVLVGKSLILLCQDASLICFNKETGIDLTPPTIHMSFPNSGEAISGQPPLQMFFRVDDEASGFDVSSVEIAIDGKKVPHEFTRDGYFVVRVSEDGPVKPLKSGRRVITVKAADNMGNLANEEFILNIDNQLRPIRLPGQTTPIPVPGAGPGGFPGGGLPPTGGGGGRGGRGGGG